MGRSTSNASNEPAPAPAAGGLVRVRLDLAYDGAPFSGWARQPGRRTVQGELEEALARVFGAPATVTVAGRTDAGVHAGGQVAHLDVPAPIWESVANRAVARLNSALDDAVRVRRASAVRGDFDARFSAQWRRYSYRASDTVDTQDPLRRHDTLWHARPLSLRALRTASKPLTGEHDFASFCRRREGATTVRRLRRLSWLRDPTGVLVATVEAEAFCHQMVRSLVGVLLLAGDGRRRTEWPAEVLAARSRAHGASVAPAHGLTLVAVGYPARFTLR